MPAPTAPTLTTPEDEAIDQSPTPTLIWEDDATDEDREVQVARDQAFTDLVFEGIGDAAMALVVYPPLTRPGPFYWRVRVQIAEDEWTDWSEVFSFTVEEIDLGYTPQYDHEAAGLALSAEQFKDRG